VQVKLCDPHLNALEVRFSRRGAIQIYVYLTFILLAYGHKTWNICLIGVYKQWITQTVNRETDNRADSSFDCWFHMTESVARHLCDSWASCCLSDVFRQCIVFLWWPRTLLKQLNKPKCTKSPIFSSYSGRFYRIYYDKSPCNPYQKRKRAAVSSGRPFVPLPQQNSACIRT